MIKKNVDSTQHTLDTYPFASYQIPMKETQLISSQFID